ncbi:protein T05A8.5 [Aphelenchoides avenae]|nr:protein T05A8.5 [Aphelenchus avenae]
MVISGSSDQSIVLNNVDTGECVIRWRRHEKEVTKVVYKHAGGKHFVLSGSRDATMKLWRFNVPEPVMTYTGHSLSVSGIAVVDETKFVSGARDTSVRLWDVTSDTPVRTVAVNRNLVTHIENMPHANFFCQTSEDRTLRLWDNRTLALIHQFPRREQIMWHCDVLPDAMQCLTSSGGSFNQGCEVTLWDIRQRKVLREFRGHEDTVRCAIFLPQQITWKRLILSVSNDRTARVWNMEDGQCMWSEIVPTMSDLTCCIGFADGNIVVAGGNATLCSMRLMGKAGRPFLHCSSVQSTYHENSQSTYNLKGS